MAQVRAAVEGFKARYQTLNILVNNVGVNVAKRAVTSEGIEKSFAINYLSPFYLTRLLEDQLIAGKARILNITSAAHKHHKPGIDFDDLMNEKDYHFLKAYSQAKLGLIYFTYELSHRLKDKGVAVNTYNPGFTKTEGMGKGSPDMSLFFKVAAFFFQFVARSADAAADEIVHLVTSSEIEGVTGKYYNRSKEDKSSDISYDQTIGLRLWDESEQILASL